MTTFLRLQCPKCKKSGVVDILPWATENGFESISARCTNCDLMTILDLNGGKEFKIPTDMCE